MMNPISVSIGPVALPTSLVVGMVSIGIAAAVGHWAGRTHRSSVGAVLLDMLLAGAVAARVGFVVTWFAQYRADPWSVVDIRDRGFLLWAGLVAAALVALWQGWRRPTLRKPLALGLVAGAMGWLSAPGALRFGVDPTVADLATVSLVTPQGHPATLAALAGGKPMVVNLWATWCPPCRREMPVLATAQREIGDVTFVFANQGEDAFTLDRYLVEQRLALANVVLDPDKGLGRKYGSMAMPTTLFFDPAGRLVDTHLGSLSAASLASKLASLRSVSTTDGTPLARRPQDSGPKVSLP